MLNNKKPINKILKLNSYVKFNFFLKVFSRREFMLFYISPYLLLQHYCRTLKADYPADSEPPIHLVEEFQLTEKPVPIVDMCFSGRYCMIIYD